MTNKTGAFSVHDKSSSQLVADPTIICTALNESRFYLMTRREPLLNSEQGRDYLNERTAQPATIQKQAKKHSLPSKVVLYTSMGELFCDLYPNECPKTVENFVTHARNGYYNNLIFHRVIKGFMIETGDPEGDGTGGVSIWGGTFEDEFSPNLKHD